MSEIILTQEQWERICAMLQKLKQAKAAKDKAKGKELSKLTKAELIAMVQDLTA